MEKLGILEEDHPRACGDYSNLEKSITIGTGSPPRLRGLLSFCIFVCFIFRITPALAGTTLADWLAFRVKQDHPRACGDYLTTSGVPSQILGSPPRLRGLLSGTKGALPFYGITPALAGTTVKRSHNNPFFILS